MYQPSSERALSVVPQSSREPSLPPFPAFLAMTEATARERTKTRIRDLMVLLVVED